MCSGEFLIKRLKFSKSRRVLNFAHWHLAGRGSIFFWTWSREQFLWLVSWFSVSFGGYLYGCICCHSILEGQNLAKVIDLIVPCFSTSWQLIVCSYTDHPDASGPATHHHAQPNQMPDYFFRKGIQFKDNVWFKCSCQTSSIMFTLASPNEKIH